jgi:hypothetical protein
MGSHSAENIEQPIWAYKYHMGPVANDLAVRRALEAAGVEFIDEDGGGPGVRLRKAKKTLK